LGSDRVQTGARVVGFEQDEHQVTVSIADGARETARVLIGADGIHSQIRAQLHGDRAPRYSGYTCWRGVTEPLPEPPSTMSESWGSGRRFGIVPIGGRCVYWFATLNAPSGGRDNLATLHADLQRIFEAFHKPVAELIESTPSHQILRNG